MRPYSTAISDGLRHGSSECGRVMAQWRWETAQHPTMAQPDLALFLGPIISGYASSSLPCRPSVGANPLVVGAVFGLGACVLLFSALGRR